MSTLQKTTSDFNLKSSSWADDIDSETEDSINLVRTEATPRPVQKKDSDNEGNSEGGLSLDSTGASWADLAEENENISKQFEGINVNDNIPTEDDGFTVVVNRKKKNGDLKGVKIKCIHCGVKFFFPNSKAEFFKKKGYNLPKRCKTCIETRKKLGPLPRLNKRKTLNIEN